MPIPAGTVYLDVVPNMGTFAPGVQSGVTKGGTASKLKGAVGTLGVALGGALAVSLAKTAVSDFQEAEAITRGLSNRIEEMGQKGRPTTQQLLDMNTQLSQMSGIDDELITKGTTLLATFGNIRNEQGKNNDIFSQANTMMVDYAAQFTGGNMTSAATQLGKALDNPIKGMTALSRVGVSFTEQETKTIEKMMEHNNILGAQKVILGAVKPQVEGAAEAGATMGMKMGVAFGEFKEAVGGLLNSALTPLMEILTPLFELMAKYPGVVMAIVGAILALVVAIKLYNTWTQIAAIAQKAMWLTNPWVLIGVAVVAVVALIIANWDKVKAFIMPLWNALKAAGIAVWNVIKAAAKVVWAAITAYVKAWWTVIKFVFNVVKTIVKAAWTVIKVAAKIAWAAITGYIKVWFTVIKTVFNVVKAIAKAVWTGIKTVVVNAINGAKAVFQAFKTALITGFNAIKSIGTSIWDGIKNAAIGVWNAIAGAWNSTVGSLSFSIPGWVPVVGGNSFDMPDIPTAAAGGLITRTGLIAAHRGELISPIEKITGGMGGGVISGELSLTPDGTAFIRGVIVEEMGEERAFTGRMARNR